MFCIAFATSVNGENIFIGLAFISASSSSVGGISGVVFILHHTLVIEHIAPNVNDAKTQFGILPVLPIKISGKISKEKLASVCPKPVKKLCA